MRLASRRIGLIKRLSNFSNVPPLRFHRCPKRPRPVSNGRGGPPQTPRDLIGCCPRPGELKQRRVFLARPRAFGADHGTTYSASATERPLDTAAAVANRLHRALDLLFRLAGFPRLVAHFIVLSASDAGSILFTASARLLRTCHASP